MARNFHVVEDCCSESEMTVTEDTVSSNSISDKSHDNRKMKSVVIVIRLVITVCILYSLDMATDLMAIYQHWNSSQWFLHYLSVGLILALLAHNILAGLYIKRNWNSSSRMSVWTVTRVIAFLFGIGNIHITIEVIVDILINKNPVDEE